MSRSRVSVATGRDRVEAVRKAFDNLGGIGNWVKRGHKVLLKPNVMAPQGTPERRQQQEDDPRDVQNQQPVVGRARTQQDNQEPPLP